MLEGGHQPGESGPFEVKKAPFAEKKRPVKGPLFYLKGPSKGPLFPPKGAFEPPFFPSKGAFFPAKGAFFAKKGPFEAASEVPQQRLQRGVRDLVQGRRTRYYSMS